MALSGWGTGRHPAPWETKECWPSFSDKQLLPEEAGSPLCSSILQLLRRVCVYVCVPLLKGATVEGVSPSGVNNVQGLSAVHEEDDEVEDDEDEEKNALFEKEKTT
ncbi:hypothetical protein ILYODFUR_025327 [Ilyodon furcidens]|uniref:Uncharacterized protein n=1 Tax=Ilyodon furcidens TaxID=33524 RepID=A0ABV0V9E8_9TELE